MFLAVEVAPELLGIGAALIAVGSFAAAKLLPFAEAYFKGHGHPLVGDFAGAIAIVAQEHEQGKDFLQAISTALRSPEAKELLDAAVAKKAA